MHRPKRIKISGIIVLFLGFLILSWLKLGLPVPSLFQRAPKLAPISLSSIEQGEIFSSLGEDFRPQHKKIRVRLPSDTSIFVVMRDPTMYTDPWSSQPQPKFWRTLMEIEPQMSVINVADNRQILDTIGTRRWDRKSKRAQEALLDTLRTKNELPADTEIYITSGRSHFYRFDEVLPHIDKAIPIFEVEEVDPWYAQAILLIESPGRNRRSTAGAHGSFQLMRGVARQMGLKVNRYTDERKDFAKAAKAAARFLKRVCIRETKRMLDTQEITYHEEDLWFRMLVLHVYHAGARNVAGALQKLSYSEGEAQLILDLWKTNYKNFGNASQNYTQIVLAAMLELDHRVLTEGEIVW